MTDPRKANRSQATTSVGKPNYCTPQVTQQVTPEVTGDVDETAKGEHNPDYDFFPWSMKPPPQKEWVGLTDEEMNELWVEYHGDGCIADGRIPEYEKAIEAKLKEKNT
jgi:hypothetical protein